jgi:decaprenyl-phosphate phosphoribosyltransferase
MVLPRDKITVRQVALPPNSATPSSQLTQLSIAKAYLQALRPKQWTKNAIIFAAPLFAFQLNLDTLLGASKAFALFCCVSSTFYLINDICDVKSDRQHPVKCKRPIAAGLVPISIAKFMALGLLGIALGFSWQMNSSLGIIVTCYACLQAFYNLKLKRVVILDIITIALGFVFRAIAGAAATSIVLSSWFILCTAMLAIFLAIEKRKAELRLTITNGGVSSRAVLNRYTLDLLGRMENVVTTGTIASYALWSSGPKMNGASTSWMLTTLPFVLYSIFRYQLLSDPKEIARRSEIENGHSAKTERPEEILLSDLPLLTNVLLWIGSIILILSFKHQGLIH